MEQQNVTSPQSSEGGNKKIWLIIFALVVLVLLVLFAMGKGTTVNTPPAVNQETGMVEPNQPQPIETQIDATASIEQQLNSIDIGDVTNDMKGIDSDVNSIR